jgi:TadE-like protein
MRLPGVRAEEKRRAPRGAAAVELALLLPVLVFCSMITVDFARVAYVQVALQNCARNGALYEFYTKAGFSLPAGWSSLSTAVNVDASAGMTVSATASTVTLGSGTFVTVTATTTFRPIALPSIHGLPSLPGTVTLSQSATMPYPAGASPVP